ncbi:MAG: hypothetical protein ACHBN1_31520 [Heteroscytonema crispum UTEX LB 1556]
MGNENLYPTDSKKVDGTTKVSIIAQKLKIITLQAVAVSEGNMIVPTLDEHLLQVSQNGDVTTLADVSRYGIPFGIVENNGNFLVTISALETGDRLLRVTKSGFFYTVADLSSVYGSFGGCFGVAAGDGFYVVAIADDVSTSQGRLIEVQRNGFISTLADMANFGTPFAVTASNDGFIVGCESGNLLRVSLDGAVTPIVNLANAGFGIPFGLVEVDTKLIVTSNSGSLLQVNSDGTISTIINLSDAGLGIPSGVAVWDNAYIVTTNAGNLLRIASV